MSQRERCHTLRGVRSLGRGLVILLAGLAVLALVGCGSGKKTSPDATQTSVRVGALVVTVPSGFRHLTRRYAHVSGVLVTDYRVGAYSPTISRGVFPANGVLLSVGRGAAHIALPRLRLPLSLRELRGPQRHKDGTAWNGTLGFRGSYYAISFWAGRSAAPHDRASLVHALASIHGAG